MSIDTKTCLQIAAAFSSALVITYMGYIIIWYIKYINILFNSNKAILNVTPWTPYGTVHME